MSSRINGICIRWTRQDLACEFHMEALCCGTEVEGSQGRIKTGHVVFELVGGHMYPRHRRGVR